jgi:hypothetical protein
MLLAHEPLGLSGGYWLPAGHDVHHFVATHAPLEMQTKNVTRHTSHVTPYYLSSGRVDDGEDVISAGVRAPTSNLSIAFEFQRQQVRETLEEAGVHVCPPPLY